MTRINVKRKRREAAKKAASALMVTAICATTGVGSMAPIYASETLTYQGLGKPGDTVYLRELPASVPINFTDTQKVTVIVTKDGAELYKQSVDSGDTLNLKSLVTDTGKIEINAVDEDTSTSEETMTVYYDTAPPDIQISGVTNGTTETTDPTIKAVVTDNALLDESTVKITLKKNGNETDITEAARSAAGYKVTEEGKYELLAVAKDKAGNPKTMAISFGVDKGDPNIAIAGDKEGLVSSLSDLTASTTSTDAKKVTITAEKTGSAAKTESANGNSVSLTDTDTAETEDEAWTITATAEDEFGNTKSVSKTITKDNLAPRLALSGAENNGKYNHEITVSGSMTDAHPNNAAMTLTKDGEAIGNADLEQTVTEEGTYTVTVSGTDKAGNKTELKRTFTIDKTPPTTEMLGEADGNYKAQPNEIKAKANEDGTVFLSVKRDGKLLTETSGKNEATFDSFDEDGVYTLTAYSVDTAGNRGEETVLTVTKDSTKPVVHISGITSGKHTNKDVSLKTEFEEKYPDKAKMVVTKDGTVLDGEALERTLLEEGSYEVTATVLDKAGNEGTDKVQFIIDKTAPETTISGVEKGKHYQSVPTVKAAANEEGTVYIAVTRDGKTVYTGSGAKETATNAFSQDGDYRVEAYSIDLAGNRSETVQTTFVKDSTAPVIALSGASEGQFYASKRTITVKVTERYFQSNHVEVSVIRTLNGVKTVVPATFRNTGVESVLSIPAGDNGEYQIVVTAVDEAGNRAATKSLSFKVDTKKPEIILSIPKKVNGYNDAVTPKAEIKDDYFKTKTVEIKKLNDPGFVTILNYTDSFGDKGGNRVYANFPKRKEYDGVYRMTVTATDLAGNTAVETMDFTVNRFGSDFSLPNGAPKKFSKNLTEDVRIREYNLAGVNQYEVVIRHDSKTVTPTDVRVEKDGLFTTYIIPKENFKEEGFYRVKVRTTDAAGNVSDSENSKGANVFFAIDRTAPTLTVTGVEANTLYKDSKVRVDIAAADTISEGATLTAFSNGKELKVEKDEKGYYVILKKGYRQTITVKATDAAGNTETKEFEKVSVSSDFFAPLLANKGLMGTVIGAIGAAIIALVYFVAKKKRKANENENDLPDDFRF